MGSDSVAVNSKVCRSFGILSKISLRSSEKLFSNNLSASSSTRNLILLSEKVSVLLSKSANRPGVAMTT